MKTKKGFYPSEEDTLKARAEVDKECLDSVWGDYWRIFVAKNNRYYLEYDVGHFMPEFVIAEISADEYDTLKKDFSQFERIRVRIESRGAAAAQN